MCHCLPKYFWWFYCYSYAVTLNWEFITRDQIFLPILAHSSSPRKLSQLPQQMLSHPSEWSTPHIGVHMICPESILSTRRMLRSREEYGAKIYGANIFTAHTQFCSALCNLQQKPTPHSSISVNFARSGPLCEQFSAHLTSTGAALWFGSKDSNQHKNVLHIHRPHSVNA